MFMEKMYVVRPVFGKLVADRAEESTFQGARGRPSPTMGPRGTIMRCTDDPGEEELQVGVPWGWRLLDHRPESAVPIEDTEPLIRRFLHFSYLCNLLSRTFPLLNGRWYEEIMSHDFHTFNKLWRDVDAEQVIEELELIIDGLHRNARKRKGIED